MTLLCVDLSGLSFQSQEKRSGMLNEPLAEPQDIRISNSQSIDMKSSSFTSGYVGKLNELPGNNQLVNLDCIVTGRKELNNVDSRSLNQKLLEKEKRSS